MPAVSGSPMPLFDRLAGDGEAQLSGADALRESVARELGRLFNTRSPLTLDAFAASDGTVLDYGLPDFSDRSLQSAPDREAIAAAVKQAITRFEPRLVNVSVKFDARAVVSVGGELRAGRNVTHVAFELAADGDAFAVREAEAV
ncbi:type VI secretion system baseplate subunit TssE [Caballeronia sp. LZ035]|uniref:type VI secretion system baseplate subunit TssE n=1 Tax=Caballeronia sp. LZ035 TaxID=3038568 RepID=UPI0028611E8E|nr:type VI secretion system baseplate subunit TssE [Caballeronia sp. LZ035]MDR5758677.1 type VI secretion system baseplate subunit TssE [Caballeronia sp. LZ035]